MTMPDELQIRIAEAIAADGLKSREQRIGLIPAMLSVIQPEIDELRADRDRWTSWAGKQEARALKAEAALAEYERVRASVTAGEPLGRALTVSEVLEQHEVTRKALIHELDVGLHLNWRQVIAATGRMRRAAFDWMKDFEQARAERDSALAALQAVREAQSLGEALAALAKHDGLTRDLIAEPGAPNALRGLLEHVGIDVAGRVITVDGVPIDDVGPKPSPEPPCGYCGCTIPATACTTCNHEETLS